MEISFKARNSNIKEAQKVCRIIRKNFDYISPSKIEKEMPLSGYLDNRILKFLYKKKSQIYEQRTGGFFIRSKLKKCEEIIYNTLRNKVANCYELSTITEMLLKINGIKNCAKASLVTSKGKPIEHSVTCIFPKNPNNTKKIIIIDPWLQECGYIDEMMTKYKNQYKDYFETINNNELSIKINDSLKLKEKEIEKLTKKFKELKNFNINKKAFDI